MDVFWYMGLIKKLKKLKPQYFAAMKYPHYLDDLSIDEKTVLLESQQGQGIDGNIWYIAKELMTNEEYSNYHIYISAKTQAVADKTQLLIDACGAGNRATVVKTFSDKYYYIMASAKYLINDNTFASYFIKKDGQVYVNTWHGTPLKTLGRGNKVSIHMLGNVQKNFFFADYMMCPNRFTYNCMVKDYMLENLCDATVLLNGYPRNTVLRNSFKRDEIRKKYGLDGYRVYAYMPTWRYFNILPRQEEKDLITQDFREYVAVEKQTISETVSFSEVTNYWLKKIDALLEDDEIMFVKAHLKEEKSFEYSDYKHIRPYPTEEETYEFLVATDKLVTDYSSVLFDYAVTGNKVVLFAYDDEAYIKNWGLHIGLGELPFPVVRDAESLVHELRTDKNYDDELFLYDYCRYDDEDATRKLLRRTMFNEDVGMTEFSIPGNGKKNILMYVGDLSQNGVTAALRGLLANVDTDKYNYYLNFQGSSASPNRAFLYELPDSVKYISRVGKMPITFKQNIFMRLYNNRLISLDRFWPVMKSAYEKDMLRQWGHNRFDTVIQFSGYEYKKQLTYSLFDANRLIYVHSNMIAEKKTRNNQRLDVLKYAYNNYDGIIAVSDAMVEPTQKIAGKPVEVSVIHNMINAPRIRRLSREELELGKYTLSTIDEEGLKAVIAGAGRVFIAVGRFSPEKGHDRLVRAFDRYWQDNPDDYLIIQGGSQKNNGYEKLLQQVNKLSAKDHIILIKAMYNPYALIARCDGMLLSSYYEGFGLVLAEGDILGLPVVSVDIDGPRPFLQENGGTIVENSEDGLFEGFELIRDGEVGLMNADYDAINRTNAAKFESLL